MEPARSTDIVSNLYQRRKQVFIRSLQGILLKISEDKVVRQMLQDKTSGKFITKRVEEIIQQVLHDDREGYIDTLVQRLSSLEGLHNQENTEKLKSLGIKILEFSDKQNSRDVHSARKIQALVEQVQALQDEVVSLRAKHADKQVDITDVNKPPKIRLLDPDYNPSSPTFMHIFGTVDLTDLQVKLKLIQTDSATSKQIVLWFMNKTMKLFAVMKNKTKQYARMYVRKIIDEEFKNSKHAIKSEDVQRHYEEEVIPQLLSKHKESLNKHKKLCEERLGEIESLRALLQQKDAEIRSLKNQHKKMENHNDMLSKQVSEQDEVIGALRKEVLKQKEALQTCAARCQVNQEAIDDLQKEKAQMIESQQQMAKESQDLRGSLEEANKQIDTLEMEVEQARVNIPRVEKALQEALSDADDLRQANAKLGEELSQAKKEANDFQRKIKKMEPVLTTTANELKDLKQSYEAVTDESAERKRKIESLKRELESRKQDITKLENTQIMMKSSSNKQAERMDQLENDKHKLQGTLTDLESTIKNMKSENQSLVKQLKEQTDNLTRQKAKTDSLQEENNELRESLRSANRKCDKTDSEAKQLQKELDNANSRIEKLSHDNESNEQQIALDREENDQLRKEIRDLKSTMQDTQTRDKDTIREANRENKQLKRENDDMSNTIKELESTVKKLRKQNEENEDLIAEHERRITELSHDKNDMTDRHDKIAQEIRQNQEQIRALTTENRAYRKAFEEAQGIAPSQLQSTSDLPHCVRTWVKNSDDLKSIMTGLKAKTPDEAADSIDTLMKRSDTLKKIGSIIGETNLDGIPARVQDLGDQLTNSHNFIKDVITRLSDSAQTPVKVTLPLEPRKREDILNLLTRMKANDRHAQAIVEKAKPFGYDGSDATKACDFIADRRCELSNQDMMNQFKSRMENVNNSMTEERKFYEKEKEDLKKQISKLKATIAKQQASGADRMDGLQEQIRELEDEKKRLQELLDQERRITEELNRIGEGKSANLELLKSKFSERTLKLISAMRTMAKMEERDAALHAGQREARKALLVGTSQPN